MPASVKSFNNYLKSQMREEWSETLAKDIRDELIRRRVIKVKESKITWSSLSNRKWS
ncbi:GpF1 (fragment) [Escherichia coli]